MSDTESLLEELIGVYYSEGNVSVSDMCLMAKKYSNIVNEELLDHCKDLAYNYDCDSDGHKYNTYCRACKSKKLYKKYSSMEGL